MSRKKRQTDIADILNARGIAASAGRSWTNYAVYSVLSNEKYIGNNVWNHVTNKLGARKTHNPPDLWIRAESAFKPIVDRKLFERAGRRLAENRAKRHLSNEELLGRLKALWDTHGYLTCTLINQSENLPIANVFQGRFGGLLRAYRLIGYKPNRDYHYYDDLPAQNELLWAITDTVIFEIRRRGGTVVRDSFTKVLTVNGELTARIGIIRCQEKCQSSFRWEIRFDTKTQPDVKIAVRLNGTNDAILDYYIFPRT